MSQTPNVQSSDSLSRTAPLPEADRNSAAQITHRVSRGDSLSAIGERYGVSVDELRRANPQIRNPDLIYPDDRIAVPAAARTHTVSAGETLSEIGERFGVSANDIAKANNIRNPDLIYPSTVLVIPGEKPTTAGTETTTPIDARPRTSSPTPIPNADATTGAFDYNQIAGVRGNPNVTPEFIGGVEAMARRLDTRPEYILGVMSFETGGSFSPREVNASSNATGLIQFLPSTAEGLGTSIGELGGMSSTQQLRYVEQYFAQYQGQLGTLEGVYTSVLSGRARPNPDDVLFASGSQAYRLNSGLDFDQDGRVTSGEATSAVAARLYGGVREVQARLVERGQVPDSQRADFADGRFGPNTSAAIRRFQQSQGLTATGLLDEATGKALFGQATTQPNDQPTPQDADVPTYTPYTVYATGGGTVRITDASQLRPHHDYQSKVREGQTLEVRDVTIAHAGQSHNAQRIPSPVSGTVLRTAHSDSAGNMVVLRGGDGGLVYLFHMTRIDVKPGQTIRYGESVGLQGSTGHSSGSHVHIEAAPSTIRSWVGDLLDGRFDRR